MKTEVPNQRLFSRMLASIFSSGAATQHNRGKGWETKAGRRTAKFLERLVIKKKIRRKMAAESRRINWKRAA